MSADVKPDPEQAMREWWRTSIIDMKSGMLAPGLFCRSGSVGILAHAWEQTQQGGCNKGPIPRQYI